MSGKTGAWRQVLDSAAVTYGNLDANGDVGTGSGQVAGGIHAHSAQAVTWDSQAIGSITLTSSYTTVHSFDTPSTTTNYAIWRMTGSYPTGKIKLRLRIGSVTVFSDWAEDAANIHAGWYLGSASGATINLSARVTSASYANSIVSRIERFIAM